MPRNEGRSSANVEIINLFPGSFASNCYLLEDHGHAVVVDPSASAAAILRRAEADGCTLDAILLTHGHFDHILSVDTLRDALWRSDGTMDQLYLALRLAVAEELTPKAPLVLDDVLVRFDDGRMQAAMKLLRAMAEDIQILCFTCQEREAQC